MAAPKTDQEDEQFSAMESGNKSSSQNKQPNPNHLIVIAQKVVAEVVGTYILIFTGCGSVVVNKLYEGNPVTFAGISITWGLVVMALIYSIGHVSGAHFNPAVTLTFAVFRHFPYKEVPLYVLAQLMGSLLGSITLNLMFHVTNDAFFGTLPAGSNGQSLAIEVIISFVLMFVIFGAGTDDRADGPMAGVAIGATITLNVLVAGQVSGASMNPARSIGPAIVRNQYRGLWVYVIGPPIGTLLAGLVYTFLRCTRTNPLVS